MLIVVTDGREECKGDPAAEVARLRASGLDLTLNIVGFSLGDAADRATMARLAAAGHGSYFDAKDEAGLRGAIDRALAVPYVVVDAAGATVGRGVVGGPAIELPAGELSVRLESAGTPIVIEHVPIAAGKPSLVELTKDGDRVGVRIVAPPTQEGSP
jgi:Ca-activated chloride channel family protein